MNLGALFNRQQLSAGTWSCSALRKRNTAADCRTEECCSWYDFLLLRFFLLRFGSTKWTAPGHSKCDFDCDVKRGVIIEKRFNSADTAKLPWNFYWTDESTWWSFELLKLSWNALLEAELGKPSLGINVIGSELCGVFAMANAQEASQVASGWCRTPTPVGQLSDVKTWKNNALHSICLTPSSTAIRRLPIGKHDLRFRNSRFAC